MKFVKLFATWQHLLASGAYRIDSDRPTLVLEALQGNQHSGVSITAKATPCGKVSKMSVESTEKVC